MNLPLISVIIPVYNAKKYIAYCLESVLTQTYQNFEIICIDDGSVDDSASTLKKYESKDKRIHIYHQENKGLPATRNVGISKATGEYICFVDADDGLHPQFLEMMLQSITKAQADVIGCDYMKVPNNDTLKNHTINITQKLKISYNPLKIKQHHCHFMVWGKLYQRHVLEKVSFNPEIQYGEDVIHSWKTYASINKIAYLKNQLYLYRQSTDSMIRRPFNYRFVEDHIRMYMELINFFGQKQLKKELKRIIQHKLNKILIYGTILYPFQKDKIAAPKIWEKYIPIIDTMIRNGEFNPTFLSWRFRIILFVWRKRMFRLTQLLIS